MRIDGEIRDVISIKTYEAKIYIGARRGYNGNFFSEEDLVKEIMEFQYNAHVVPIRVSRTQFVVNGTYRECGWEITAISYPYAPQAPNEINSFALSLSRHLMKVFEQEKITISFPERTILLEFKNMFEDNAF